MRQLSRATAKLSLRAVLLLVQVIVLTAQADRGNAAPASLTVNLWWVPTSSASGVLEHAREFGITGVILEHDSDEVPWGVILDGLSTYDFDVRFRREGAARAAVERRRDRYRELTSQAQNLGLQTYLLCPEIHVPPAFGNVDLDDPAVWDLLGQRLREVFRALPQLTGYMLYLSEGDQDLENLPGREHSNALRVRKLLETCWSACRAEDRQLLVATFTSSREMLNSVAEALRSFPPNPNFAVVHYCCPGDWGLYALTNPAIGHVGPHPEILGFDACGENWGQGSYPCIQAAFMATRLQAARLKSNRLIGVATCVGWGQNLAFGSLNEANLFAAQALAQSPERSGDDILREWSANRFGESAADVAANCLARTQNAVFKSQHLLGYWIDTDTKSSLPSLSELDRYLIRDTYGEALTKWDPDPGLRRIWNGIISPDEDFVQRMLAEKSESIALTNESIEELRTHRSLFRDEDARTLEDAFRFQDLWGRAWRDHLHAFFLRCMARREGWPPTLNTRLERTLDRVLINADEMERRYGSDMFPAGPDREREFVQAIRAELRSRPPEPARLRRNSRVR